MTNTAELPTQNEVTAQKAKVKIANLFILDRSPSMANIKAKIIQSFNEQLDAIKQLDKDNGTESTFSFVDFDENVKVHFLKKHLDFAPRLNNDNYNLNGSGTAFYDGLCIGIKSLEEALGAELTDTKVLVTVLTDGLENSSKKYMAGQARDILSHFQNEYDWTITFIGANIDVEKLATDLNVAASNTISFMATSEGTKLASDTLISARSAYYTKSLNGEDTKRAFFKADK